MKIPLPKQKTLNRYIGEGLARAGPFVFVEKVKSCLLEARHGPP